MPPTTLTSLHLKNYRGFRDHKIDFKPLTVLVGRNNAGKSTIVEALRFISLICARYRYLDFRQAPNWSKFPKSHYGVSPSLERTEFTWKGLFHQYNDPPAEVVASFSDGRRIAVRLGPSERIHGVLMQSDGKPVRDRSEAARADFGRLATMPQVAPLRPKETRLVGEYVRAAVDSHLAPAHFRNQLIYFDDHWHTFCELVASSWPGVVVKEIERGVGLTGEDIALLLRERDFVAEVGSVSHGLQVWLQVMWFFARTPMTSMVVLDEPDVYMHADLQRRIIRLLKGRFVQTIVATHSSEILSEVEPDDVLVIDRQAAHSGFAESLPAVEQVMNSLGTVHNVQLTRLWRSRRFLIVEDDDLEVLAKLHSTLFPTSTDPLRNVPHVGIGGWGGWQQVMGSRLTLRNAVGEAIETFCILDRDYNSDDAIAERVGDAERLGIRLHVWDMKELENYLLVPSAIQRVIEARARRRTQLSTVEEVQTRLDAIFQELKGDVADKVAERILTVDRGKGLPRTHQSAREIVDEAWRTYVGRLRLVPGKEALRRLSEWSQSEFSVGISVSRLASVITPAEIATEVQTLLTEIEECSELR
jgi:hypothetical protein